MGLLKRLRAASSSRKPPETAPSVASSSNPQTTTSTAAPRSLKRSPSTALLAVPSNGELTPPPRVSTSSTVASSSSASSPAITPRSSMLPWKKDRRRPNDELQSIPYDSTSASPLRGSGSSAAHHSRPSSPHVNVPTIETHPTTPPTRPPRAQRPQPSPGSPTNYSSHQRTASHESSRTVISLSSTFTGRSRRTSSSTEWKQEGGVLGKFAFESTDWASIGGVATPFQSPPPSAAPSKQTTPGGSPVKHTGMSTALAMSPTPKAKNNSRETRAEQPTMRKLGATHTSPSLPSVSTFSNNPWGAHSPDYPSAAGDWSPSKQREKAGAGAMVKGKGKKDSHLASMHQGDVTGVAKAQTPPKGPANNLKEEVEEIFTSTSEPDLDEKRPFWKPGMRTRRTSKTRPPEERPVSMSSIEQRPQLRRPNSSLFHNPFGRTQSRVSLGFELDQQTQADDGSFQLKSFRHISGVGAASADAEAAAGFPQYLGLSKSNGDEKEKSSSLRDRQSSSNTIVPRRTPNSGADAAIPPPSPSAPPRPRPPSAAGSDASQRVSVAAFRKNVRRPSSSVLVDDDDDMPLSLSRAQIFEGAGLRRDSGSAVSLTESQSSPPPRPKRSLPPTPMDEGSRTPSFIGLGAPPPLRASNPPSPSVGGGGFVVKGPRRNLDAKDVKKLNDDHLSSPTLAQPTDGTASPKVVRPPRQSSLSVASDDALVISLPPITTTAPDGQSITGTQTITSPGAISPSGTTPSFISARSASRSPPPPPPQPLKVPEPQANLEDLLLKLPPRPDEMQDEPTVRVSPGRSSTLSPSLSMAFDEPLRRISGLWGGASPGDEGSNSDQEEAFDPAMVQSTLRQNQYASERRGSSGADAQENRQSLFDRLSAATAATSSVIQSALPSSSSDPDRLYIPPPRTPSPPPIQAQSPSDERTPSPVPVPPPMEKAPEDVPSTMHSSFGRPPRRAAEKPVGARGKKSGWASSSSEDDEDDAATRRRPATSASTITTRTTMSARTQPAGARPMSSATILTRPTADAVETISESSDEDQPLQALKTSRSRSDLQTLRPVLSRSSLSASSGLSQSNNRPGKSPQRPPSILKNSTSNLGAVANAHANGAPNGTRSRRPSSTHAGPTAKLTPSASKWSLSSSPDDSDDMAPPMRPPSRPTSRHSARPGRPQSRVSIHDPRDQSRDRRSMARAVSQDPMPKLPRNRSSDLLPRPPSTGRLRALPTGSKVLAPSPRHPMAAIANDGRPTASPASSQSGLTGDSSTQQPMTPRSVADPSRRSWADGRPRPDAETASVSGRPTSQFDWASVQGQFPYPGMDPYGQAAMKNQIQAQWMAAAQRHFEDMWERASSVSNAQTVPNGPAGMFSPTYGYSYNQPPAMPAIPQMPPMGQMGQMGNMYGYQQYPYGAFGGPSVAFPPGMMGMGGPPMPGIPGMPMGGAGGGGGGYSYETGVQSVYGGEFGPPVAPAMRETVPGSPGGSPNRQRARRTSGQTDGGGGRPASAHLPSSSASVIGVPTSHYGAQRTPPRRPAAARRQSGLALSEVGGPPSSWRSSVGDDLETPRPKRVTNAS